MNFLSQNEGEPAKFIRELKDKSSLLVFYEDQSYMPNHWDFFSWACD
jgi:hypothetical protein